MAKRLIYFAAAFVLLLIGGFQLNAANLLYAQDGAVFGAGYTDLRILLPMYYIASAACVLTAITLLLGLKKLIEYRAGRSIVNQTDIFDGIHFLL